MRRIRFRLCSACMAVILLLSLLLPSAAQAAGGSGSLADAAVSIAPCAYNGSPQRPKAEVVLNGVNLTEGVDYTISYQNNTNAGEATAVLTAAEGRYTGSIAEKFEIRKRSLRPQDFTVKDGCTKPFDGTTRAEPDVQVSALAGDQVDVTWGRAVYDTKFVGTGKTVTVYGLSLSGPDGNNYELADPAMTLTSAAGQITPVPLKIQPAAQLAAGGASLDLAALITGAQKDSLFIIPESKIEEPASFNGTVLISGTVQGPLTFFVQAEPYDSNRDEVPEYIGGTGRITVTIVEQEEQPPLDITGDQPALSLTGSERVTYGQTLQFGTTGGAGSGNVTYAVQNISGSASISAGGLLTPVKAGTVLVTASKAGDGRYGPTSSEGVVVTIYPASLTITVRDKRAQVGDPIPALTASDYTISGLVGGDRMQTLPTLSYERTPDMARADRVTIRASGAAVPSGGNYAPDIRYVPGTLTVSERPVYGILVRQAANGTLSADQTSAEPGTRITVTAKAAEGYQVETVTATADGGNRLRLTDKGNGVFAFTMPDGPVTVTGTFVKAEVPPAVLPFTDVKEGDWFYENVAYVFANGLMNGTSETQFSPGRAITRGMIVTILYRMEGSPATAAWSPFADVAAEKYYAVPVAWAAWNGIVNGQSATAFGPEAPVTREQLAAIFYRYAGYKGYDTNARANLTRFADGAQVHAYAETALSWANAEALVSGKGNGILDPRGQATRAQAAAIFQRFCAWIVP